MTLKNISIRLALQFTAFVTLLLLINGVTFIIADFRSVRRSMDGRLLQESRQILERLPQFLSIEDPFLPQPQRRRVRIVDSFGQVLYAGEIFEGTVFDPNAPELINVSLQGEGYRLITTPVIRYGVVAGFLQVASRTEMHGDFQRRGYVLVFTSALISGLTFLVGLFFARKNLKPVEETMQRLEQFTQDASHELRTPLAVLGSTLDVALKTKKYKEGIDSAKEDLGQISVLVERLLELARLDSFVLDRHAVDVSSLLEQTAAKFTPLAAAQSVTITAEIAPGITVQSDEALLRQVLGNLLNNAIKFNAPGGSIALRLTKKTLSIADTGIGIRAEDLPHLFDRFYQVDTSRSRGGLGLGLALVKRITDLHGWTIDVKSEPGKGTTFTLRFS